MQKRLMPPMALTAEVTSLEAIRSQRELYRREMKCQIIHDSIHARPGWTIEYLLKADGEPAGYGSVAVAGPWKECPSIYEFFVLPQFRQRTFDLFSLLLSASQSHRVETQSNDPFLTPLLHTFAEDVECESILFRDHFKTTLSPPGAVFREAAASDKFDLRDEMLWSHGIVELDGKPAARGGVLFHYNPPYGDIYMETSESFRQRGLGSFLVQELKRVAYEHSKIPAARCNPKNIASRKTLQKAGFVPCGNIIIGTVATA